MKKILLILAAALAPALTVLAADPFEPPYPEKEVLSTPDVTFRQIDPQTWHGNGHEMWFESLYLVEGRDRAVLIDAGTNIRDLDKIVARITDKPVSLIATHVHPDHTGSAVDLWPEIRINAADMVQVPAFMPQYKGKYNYYRDGDTIDLGDRRLIVVFTPGHTPGSVTLIDPDRKLAFSGDAFGTGNLLLFTNFSTELATCERMLRELDRFGIEEWYSGHYCGVNKENRKRVELIRDMCRDALDGKLDYHKSNAHPNFRYEAVRDGMTIRFNDSALR